MHKLKVKVQISLYICILQVSQLYQDTTLGYSVKIVLVGLVILDGDEVCKVL